MLVARQMRVPAQMLNAHAGNVPSVLEEPQYVRAVLGWALELVEEDQVCMERFCVGQGLVQNQKSKIKNQKSTIKNQQSN